MHRIRRLQKLGGTALTAICAALEKGTGAVYAVLTCTGGIAPWPRRRARWALTLEEREEITRGIAAHAKRPKRCVLAHYPALRAAVAAQLAEDWSPQQIARWLVTEYPDDPTMRVSPETLYRSLYIQARGVLKKELIAHLRRRHPIRRRRGAARRPAIGAPAASPT